MEIAPCVVGIRLCYRFISVSLISQSLREKSQCPDRVKTNLFIGLYLALVVIDKGRLYV